MGFVVVNPNAEAMKYRAQLAGFGDDSALQHWITEYAGAKQQIHRDQAAKAFGERFRQLESTRAAEERAKLPPVRLVVHRPAPNPLHSDIAAGVEATRRRLGPGF